MKIPKFVKASGSFHAELKTRVNDYFDKVKKIRSGNFTLYSKAIIITVSFLIVYLHLILFANGMLAQHNVWLNILLIIECIMLAGLTSAIGFNIMHDGAHGSFSSKKWVNDLAGVSLNFLGGNVFMWKAKHNVVHHTFTNIADVDDDIDAKPFLRLCEDQKHYKMHRYQHFYFLLAYSLLYLYWIVATDYTKYFTRKVGNVKIQKMPFPQHFSFWGFKVVHIFMFAVLPILTIGFLPWLVGFLIYVGCAGIILSVVFQLAHTVQETQFPQVNLETGLVEDEWAIHQLKTTANFATKSKFWNWFTGGLNFQVEHHLFPNISHVHYPAISKIVKAVCAEYNIPYLEHAKIRTAFASHVSHLRAMGRK